MSDCTHPVSTVRYDLASKSYVTSCRTCKMVLKSYLVEDTSFTAFFRKNRERSLDKS